jgi:hypothetical protein
VRATDAKNVFTYGPPLLNFVLVRIILANKEIVSLPKELLNFFSVAFGARLARVSSRPFRTNRFLGYFPGLKPWAESYSPSGAKNIPNCS